MKEELETLTIYMKSGNKVVIPNVDYWQFKDNGECVDLFSISVDEESKDEVPIMTSFQLSQIELITRKKQ